MLSSPTTDWPLTGLVEGPAAIHNDGSPTAWFSIGSIFEDTVAVSAVPVDEEHSENKAHGRTLFWQLHDSRDTRRGTTLRHGLWQRSLGFAVDDGSALLS